MAIDDSNSFIMESITFDDLKQETVLRGRLKDSLIRFMIVEPYQKSDKCIACFFDRFTRVMNFSKPMPS